ncbi:MAG: GDP-L-fucose synthase, partial [Myxococcales bacterium]
GHSGLVGSALVRRLERGKYTNLLLRSHRDVDLTERDAVHRLFDGERPDVVFMAAARVGGILANDRYRGDFIRENLEIQTHMIDAARRFGTKKLVFLGSSCIYPRLASQPIREESLLTGPLEPTNEAYAVAKIAGITMVRAYRKQFGLRGICLMPTNLYGPGDNFDLETSHVLAALLRRVHEAKRDGLREVVIWGSGEPRREFLHVDDLADACVFLAETYDSDALVNIGVGDDISIRELATTICEVVGYQGALRFDTTRPDGTPRKLLDVTRLRELGWRASTPLRKGLEATYAWYLEAQASRVLAAAT